MLSDTRVTREISLEFSGVLGLGHLRNVFLFPINLEGLDVEPKDWYTKLFGHFSFGFQASGLLPSFEWKHDKHFAVTHVNFIYASPELPASRQASMLFHWMTMGDWRVDNVTLVHEAGSSLGHLKESCFTYLLLVV